MKDRPWVRNPIDAFVLAKLEATGLAPAPPADRRALIRRVTFDLTGLPPTPSRGRRLRRRPRRPDAYERVVDRLLASPRYGERWARHWLDVVRYAETDGYELDATGPHGLALPRLRHPAPSTPTSRTTGSSAEQIAGDVLDPGRARDAAGRDRLPAAGTAAVTSGNAGRRR